MVAGILRAAANLAFVAAAVIAVFTLVSDHSADYGEVKLPGQGKVDLPQGSVDVFYKDPGTGPSAAADLAAPVRFRVAPVRGGVPVLATANERSVGLGDSGEISTFEAPYEGVYNVSGSVGAGQAGARLTFGTDAATAVTRKSDLFVALLGGGLLAGLIASILGRRRRSHPVDHPYDVRPESMQQPQQTYYNG